MIDAARAHDGTVKIVLMQLRCYSAGWVANPIVLLAGDAICRQHIGT